MVNIITAIILVLGSIFLYWMYISASKVESKKPVDSSNKPSLNVQVQDEYEESKMYVPPVNSYIQSVKGLDLNFSEDLTEIKVEEAYLTIVKNYILYLDNKQTPPYNIAEKEAYRNYLITSLRTKIKKD